MARVVGSATVHGHFQQQIVDRDRPGHLWRVEDGKIIYIEDAIMEMELGRKLTYREEVVHKNGDPLDNRKSNLEVVTIESVQN